MKRILIKLFLTFFPGNKAAGILLLFCFIPQGSAFCAERLPWPVGEKLVFAIKWGLLTCGYATMEVAGITEVDSIPAYRIVSTARSAPFFDNFYKVRDNVESIIRTEGLYSLRFSQNIQEGKYKKNIVINYDHENLTAEENGHSFGITFGIQDVLSSLYFIRTKELVVGQYYEFDVGTGKKTWPLRVDIIRKETISVPAGEYDTIVVIPRLREEGIFKAKGDLEIWLTDDELKIPVRMRSKIEFGSINALLIEKHIP